MRLRAILLRLPAIVIVAAVWIISSQRALPRIKGILGFDKIQHFIAYAVLAVAVGFWFSRSSWLERPKQSYFISAAIASFYGAVDELHQYFVPGRASSAWDWIFDTLGALLGAALCLVVERHWHTIKHK